VEATSAAGIMRIIDYNWGWQGMDGSVRPRFGNWDLAINIYAVNPCKDGQIMVGGGHDRLWFRIWKTVGKDRPELEQHIIEDPSLKIVVDRLPFYSQVETYTTFSDWFKDNTRLEAETKLQAEEVASGGVTFTDEVAEFPHFKYRGHVNVIDDTLYGKVLHAPPPQLAQKAPPRLKWIGRPTGYDNEEIYRRIFGFKKDDIDGLKKRGVI
jgi:crotonobetainyl-CoA:carnitine CoA-transferase CaiB-like acyl-CoA transferase